MFFNDPKADACILLDLLLQILRKLLVAFCSNDGERVDLEAAQSFSILIDT